MSVKKKRTIGPCRGVTWLYYVVLLWSRDFFPPLYLDPRFRPLLLKLFFDSEDMYTALKMIADFKRSCNGKAKPMPPEIVPWSW